MDNILNVDFALSSNNIDPLRGLCEQFKNELVTTILDQELLLAIWYSCHSLVTLWASKTTVMP